MKTPNTKNQTPMERPILFSGDMVRAILDGRKTQTRRVVKPQPTCARVSYEALTVHCYNERNDHLTQCCFHNWNHKQPGDRLWVKETFRHFGNSSRGGEPVRACVEYKADGKTLARGSWSDFKSAPREKWWNKTKPVWKPSIFMPRWASRITLEILSVRVERLQAINESDAKAEGISERATIAGVDFEVKRVSNYAHLWEAINGPGSWAKNPWVWVIEFRKL